MKNILFLISVSLMLFACQKDRQLDVRDFGKVSIDSITPAKGPSDVYITAYVKNFPYQESEIQVTLNDKRVTVVDVSHDTVLLHIPAGAVSGKLNFLLDRKDPSHTQYNYAGLLDSVASIDYVVDETVIPRPVIRSYSPAKALPGTEVEITGYNFSALTGAVKVMFGNIEGTIVNATNTSIKTKVPQASPAIFPLVIVQNGIEVTAGNFEILEPPPPLLAVYWTNVDSEIKKITFNTDGTYTSNTLFDINMGVSEPTGISTYASYQNLDTYIFWANAMLDFNTMTYTYSAIRGDLNGTPAMTTVYPRPGTPAYAVNDMDVSGGVMYMGVLGGTNAGSHYIVSKSGLVATRAGKEIYELPNNANPTGIKLSFDPLKTDIWWVERKNKTIVHGKKGGAGDAAPAILFDAADGLENPTNIAVDETHGKIFIMDAEAATGKPRIFQGNIDGSGVLTKLPIAASEIFANFGPIMDLEIDPGNGYLYWMNTDFNGKLMRCKTDGSNVQVVADHIVAPIYFDILLP